MITGIAWLDALLWLAGFLGLGAIGGNVLATSVNKKIALKLDEEREERKKQESDNRKSNLLMQKGLCAIGHLAEANAYALVEGKVNGRMTTALDYYHDYRDESNAFLQEQAVENLTRKAS